MPVLPIVLLINLGAGCTSTIADFKAGKPESMNPGKIIKQIQEHKVTRLVSSPFFVKQLAKYISENALSVPYLKKIFTGGAPVFPLEAELYHQAFPRARRNCLRFYRSRAHQFHQRKRTGKGKRKYVAERLKSRYALSQSRSKNH